VDTPRTSALSPRLDDGIWRATATSSGAELPPRIWGARMPYSARTLFSRAHAARWTIIHQPRTAAYARSPTTTPAAQHRAWAMTSTRHRVLRGGDAANHLLCAPLLAGLPACRQLVQATSSLSISVSWDCSIKRRYAFIISLALRTRRTANNRRHRGCRRRYVSGQTGSPGTVARSYPSFHVTQFFTRRACDACALPRGQAGGGRRRHKLPPHR